VSTTISSTLRRGSAGWASGCLEQLARGNPNQTRQMIVVQLRCLGIARS
jgi:hypothetical protein